MSSASIEFPYSRRPGQHRTLLFPAVPAEVLLPLGFHPIRPLLDSGADCSMLPRYIGELIGLNFARLPVKTITGIEGRSIRGFKAFVRLRIDKLPLPPIPC